MKALDELLMLLVESEGSDMHLCSGRKPHIRVNGELLDSGLSIMRHEQIRDLIYTIITKEQAAALEKYKELDIGYMIPDFSRFRLNVYQQRGTYAATIRAIPFRIKTFEELGIPPLVKSLIDNMNGLILVTGAQGNGKTTTLASIIDYINTTRKAHIITVEDPIEYVHRSKKGVVNQREVGRDTVSYSAAMKYILRQDPDVCLIGEIRDPESVRVALSMAEAGILVLSTVHSSCASKTISRIADSVSADLHQQICLQLSLTLKAVISQQLIPRIDKKGRILACEIMRVTGSIEHMIRNGSIKQIDSVIQTSKEFGMRTMDQALLALYTEGKISKYELKRRVTDIKRIEEGLEQYES